jgi:hypothetical protein
MKTAEEQQTQRLADLALAESSVESFEWTVLGVGYGKRLTWAPEESPVRSDQRPFCATHGTDTF